MQRVQKPIVIVGTGRCGSTLLHRLLARHPDIGWLSPFNEVFPRQTWLSALSGLYDPPRLGRRLTHLPFFPKPFESYRFWEHYLPGFSRRDRSPAAEDVPPEGIAPVRRAVGRVLRYQKRSRFLVKVTGWSRIGYFDRIFPDALFVFLNREPRAVISSWIRAGWLDVTTGPRSDGWQWGEVPSRYLEAWEGLGGGPVLSAALKVQLDLDDIRTQAATVGDRFREFQYEDLIARPVETLREMAAHCGLAWPADFEAEMRAREFFDTTDKWRRHLSEELGRRILTFFDRLNDGGPPLAGASRC